MRHSLAFLIFLIPAALDARVTKITIASRAPASTATKKSKASQPANSIPTTAEMP